MPKRFRNGRELALLADIQSAEFDVLELVRDKWRRKRQAQNSLAPATAAMAATPASSDASAESARRERREKAIERLETAIVSEQAKRLARMSGGVCHGMTYAWFAALANSNETVEQSVRALLQADGRDRMKQDALRNQATLNYRVIAHDDVPRARAKMAADAGFMEQDEPTPVVLTGVTVRDLQFTFRSVVKEAGPRTYYRLSLATAAGKHSIGIVFERAKLYLLDPDCGIFAYDYASDADRDLFIADLHEVLVEGYRCANMEVFATAAPAPDTRTEEEKDDSIARLLAELAGR